MIPGAITMIGITALQDVRQRRSDELAGAAAGYALAVCRGTLAQQRAAHDALELAGRAFGDADHALEIVTTAARAATAETPRRPCGECYADDEPVAGGSW